MCGILIFQSKKINNLQKSFFFQSLKKLEKRGPDKTSYYIFNNNLIGFTRLSINNINNGLQPFESLCGKYIVVFNGEIINYKILLEELKNRKINIKFGNECEVIVNLFILYKEKCLQFLRGFFAFVIIEKKTSNIFAAVDRFSIKPLYYSENIYDDLFIITSDYSCILNPPALNVENISYHKIIEYFIFARDFDNQAFYKDIKRIEAGSYITKEKNFKDSKFSVGTYWKPFQVENTENINKSLKVLKSEFEILLSEVLKLWKISEVPVSLCLSTGVDSRILSFLMTNLNIKFTSFSILEDKKFYDEHKHINFSFNFNNFITSLNSFFKNNKSPSALAHMSSSTLIPFYQFIKKKGFKVTMNGEGADEINGGYIRFSNQLKCINNHKSSFEESFLEVNRNLINNFNLYKNKKLDNVKNLVLAKILSVKLSSKKNENKLLEFDQLTWIPYLIKRHDRIGMNYGLEVRPPFLDHKFVEFMNALPVEYKFTSSSNKIFFKKFLQNNKINYNRKKIGTPTLNSLVSLILKNKKEMTFFKESLFYSKISNFFDVNKILEDLPKNKLDSHFFWRLFVLNKILNS